MAAWLTQQLLANCAKKYLPQPFAFMSNPLDKIATADDRADIKDRVLRLFGSAKTLIQTRREKTQVTSKDLDQVSNDARLGDTINLRGASDQEYLGKKLKLFAIQGGLESKDYRPSIGKVYPEIQQAGFAVAKGEYADGWTHFHPTEKHPSTRDKIQAKDGSEIEVTYKTYLSLDVESRMAVKNIDRFLRHLPRIASTISALAKKHDADISFKIPANLEEMLLLRDTLVIHTNRRDILPEIHSEDAKALSVDTDKTVELERDARGQFG